MAILIANKKARLSWEISETLDAGIELFGFEVKSVRKGQGSLEGASVVIRGQEAFLVGATISPYQAGNTPAGYEPTRTRRLLLNRSEINSLFGLESQRGISLIPLALFTKNNLIKLEVGVGRHKKKHDKRETLKKRDTAREIDREMKQR